ncbi:hypothetical protein AAG570_006501 [Ranatra chinensis]|uniref:Uncharacterized protein n=1 Tax=Ranatra chinensis TaxID=642074 RepID=A0ABD0YU64_9HEMI
MAYKHRNMFYQNKKQEMTEIGRSKTLEAYWLSCVAVLALGACCCWGAAVDHGGGGGGDQPPGPPLSPQEEEALLEELLEAAVEAERKRRSGGVLAALADKKKDKIHHKLQSLYSLSHYPGHYDSHYEDLPLDYEHKSFDLWTFKKAILGALVQAIKAITGGVIALKGQILKVKGHLVATKGEVLKAKGEAITDLGKHIATKALHQPAVPYPSAYFHGPPSVVHHHHHTSGHYGVPPVHGPPAPPPPPPPPPPQYMHHPPTSYGHHQPPIDHYLKRDNDLKNGHLDGGYYKVRAPPPPPLPPATIHYGPHPPPAQYYHSHRIQTPQHHHHHHFPHYPSRKLPHPPRDFHYHHHQPPPKPNYIPAWKGPTTNSFFRAPLVKETFNPPPISYPSVPTTTVFVRDDDKGPIHTIPAPNLSPADQPFRYNKVDPNNAALTAVLNHGIHHLSAPHSLGYQVTEDPTAHLPQSGVPAYFAPDPDPSLPTFKVPPTTDPKSQPSNGQVPLDLYLQQQAEAAQSQAQQSTDSNTLTAQDLFNLLNYQSNLIPQNQLQQHVLQPNVQFYNQPVLVSQPYQEGVQQQQQFSPQFQTFNYDEQTQQSAHGSDSFPSASMNLQLLQPESRSGTQSTGPFPTDNQVSGSDKMDVGSHHSQERLDTVPFNHAKVDHKYVEQFDSKLYKNHAPGEPNHFSTPSLNTKETGSPRDDLTRSGEDAEPKENVQLQKSIQIYENPYAESKTKSDPIDYNEDYSHEESDEKIKSMEQPGNDRSSESFGNKTRPKRF